MSPPRLLSVLATALLAASVTPACSLLKDPVEPWVETITYADEGGSLKVSPSEIEVDGPVGFVVLNNETFVERGFAIDELAVYEKVGPEGLLRFRLDEMEDRTTYTFYDHENDDVVLGTITVAFREEDVR